MLNSQLNIENLKQAFMRNNALSVPNILQPDAAQRIHDALEGLDWILEINDYSEVPRLQVPVSDLKHPDNLLAVLDEVENGLDRDKLFFTRLRVDSENFNHPELLAFSEFLGSDGFLGVMKEVTGMPELGQVWVEATCYEKCCFFGAHRDDHHPQNRVAFAFNLTPQWLLDWGGLLMLKQPNLPPSIVPPSWNSLSMFTVPYDHFVSSVSPAAIKRRYSLTGWLRD